MLVRRREVGFPPPRLRLAEVTHGVEQSGLETRERKLEPGDAREQAEERRLEWLRLDVEGRDVSFEVVDGDERQALRPRDRLRRRQTDEERADENRPLRDRAPRRRLA